MNRFCAARVVSQVGLTDGRERLELGRQHMGAESDRLVRAISVGGGGGAPEVKHCSRG